MNFIFRRAHLAVAPRTVPHKTASRRLYTLFLRSYHPGMKIILQRVRSAAVEINGETVGRIGAGVLLLVGFGEGDTAAKFPAAAEKISVMRIFPNQAGKFDKSLSDIGGAVLLVPQFTLFADTSKGRRPDFFGALRPELAIPLFEKMTAAFEKLLPGRVETGRFGADMLVSLENDGPVTIPLEF